MTESEQLEIEAACYRLVTDYCHFVDHGEASRIADLFTADGVWTSPENTMTGLDELREGFQAREDNKGRMSRHVCNNFRLFEISKDRAKGCVYLTLYRHDGEAGRSFSPLEGPAMVGEYVDEFVRTDDGWRIKHRAIKVDFVRRD